MINEEQKKSIMKELLSFKHEEESLLEKLVEPSNKNGYYSKKIADRYLIAKAVFKWLDDTKELKKSKIQKVNKILYSNKDFDFLLFDQKEKNNLKVFANVLKSTLDHRPFWLRAFTDFEKPYLATVIYS